MKLLSGSLKSGLLPSAILILLTVVAWVGLFSVQQPDYGYFLLPWLTEIRESDGLSTFATGFSNYTGGYVTILWLIERVDALTGGMLGDLAVIKIAALVGSVLCAVGVWTVLRALGWPREHALPAAIGLLLLPEVLLNGVAMGQADALYVAFLTFTLAAMLRERPLAAAAWFAVALAIKLQAIWIAPFFGGWLLRRPRAILPAIAMVPAAYLLVNSLYLIAGRPLTDVLLIYFEQFGTFRHLSVNAPNLWLFIDRLAPGPWFDAHYSTLVLIGLIIGVLGALVIFWQTYRRGDGSPVQLLYWATVCALAMPFLLPKMHERFFFAAGVFTYLLALVDRRFVLPAVLVQAAAVLSYSVQHDTFGVGLLLGVPKVGPLAVLCMTMALVLLVKMRHLNAQSTNIAAPRAFAAGQ